MKILLTGKPRSGKTTLLMTLLENVRSKRGMVAVEVLKDSKRIGFELQDNSGHAAVLARTDKKTDINVGRYFVDLTSVDAFIEPLSDLVSDQLLYVDEIGHMQLYSEKFQKLVRAYLNAPNDYLGTVSSVYEHPFSDEVKRRKDILICTITPDNRDVMLAVLNSVLKHRTIFNDLPVDVQSKVLSMARDYLSNEAYISLKKLFNNAIVYIAEDRIKETSPNTFIVYGNHGEHHVSLDANSCDCDFFNGRGQFSGKAGECSHIQAVNVLKMCSA